MGRGWGGEKKGTAGESVRASMALTRSNAPWDGSRVMVGGFVHFRKKKKRGKGRGGEPVKFKAGRRSENSTGILSGNRFHYAARPSPGQKGRTIHSRGEREEKKKEKAVRRGFSALIEDSAIVIDTRRRTQRSHEDAKEKEEKRKKRARTGTGTETSGTQLR